jgi:coenzyme F420-dependent glucose-6-phosphate dehydrogenase
LHSRRLLTLGFHFSHEQLPPSTLLRHATLAAQAGFEHAMCSDHFQPFSERQGHSGFAWSWLGAALTATPMSFGTVCAPGQRYHPAIVAQAAATLAEMYPDRFWLAVGSGEAVNESITGQPWPPKPQRKLRLTECVSVMRELWAGRTVTIDSHVVSSGARLHVRPAKPVLLLGAALTTETARWVGGWADGLITAAQSRDAMRAIVDAFREGGGTGKPMFLQVALSYAPSDEEAAAAAFDQWPQCVLTPQQMADIASPAEFDRACAHATLEEVVARSRVSSDAERHLAWLHEDAALGFDRIYLHNLARAHQEAFIEMSATRLLPALKEDKVSK